MASPYLNAMNHQEWTTQKVLKKHLRNRPLGKIEDYHLYKPVQPVLSCRTIDIDLTGTRTYRACSTADIIEEQHKIIHKIYTNARNVTSAPSGRPVSRLNVNTRALSSPQVPRTSKPRTNNYMNVQSISEFQGLDMCRSRTVGPEQILKTACR